MLQSNSKIRKNHISPDGSTVLHGSTWRDFGTVVLKFKCKFCDFEASHQLALRSHNLQVHRSTKSNDSNDVIKKSGSVSQKSSTVHDSAEMNLSNKLIQHKIEVGVQNQSSQIYLCSDCNIAFSSEELCCEHMSLQHGLEEFDDSVLMGGTRSRTSQELKPTLMLSGLPKRRRVSLRKSKPTKHLTMEDSGVVPKSYRKDPRSKCSICDVKFEQQEILQIHEQCHNKNILDNKDVADNGTCGLEGPEHFTRKTLKGYTCILCVWQQEQSPSTKVTGKNNESPGFARWAQCATHLWRAHEIDCELHQCDKCNFKTFFKSRLRDHQAVHGTARKLKCETCHKTFKQLTQLRTHEKYHKERQTKLPPPEDTRWYTPKVCPICQRILSDQKCLKRHISSVHDKLKTYVCNVCGHMSARKAELQLHMRQHTNERPFKCTFCSYATKDHNSLRRHKRLHTETDLYKCPHCDYKCVQSISFKKHILLKHPDNDKESIYLCTSCTFVSVNPTLFEAHLKNNHDDSKIPCRPDEAKTRISSNEDETLNEPNSPSTNDSETSVDLTQETHEGDNVRKISVRTQSWLREDTSDDDSDSEESISE